MNQIICFGEALIDMLNTDQDNYQAFVGGAPANVAVGIAKLGGKAKFIGQVGKDKFGTNIIHFLLEHQVDIQDLLTHPFAKTALAFVQLDDTGDRSFSFYREQTADVLMKPSQLKSSSFADSVVFHLCSNTLTTQNGFELTMRGIELAKKNSLLISFDLNLRDELWPNATVDLAKVQKTIEKSDIVKFAEEELRLMCGENRDEYIQRCLHSGVKLVVVTNGAEDVQYFTNSFCGAVIVPNTYVLDTTGAGDSFVAGLLTAVATLSSREEIMSNQPLLEQSIAFASECSAMTVAKYGACASFPYITEVANCHGIF